MANVKAGLADVIRKPEAGELSPKVSRALEGAPSHLSGRPLIDRVMASKCDLVRDTAAVSPLGDAVYRTAREAP